MRKRPLGRAAIKTAGRLGVAAAGERTFFPSHKVQRLGASGRMVSQCFLRGAVVLLLLPWSFLLLPPVFAAVQNDAPLYAGSYAGSCDILLQPPSGLSPSLYAESITIATNGNDFTPMTIAVGSRGGPTVTYSLTGAFGCAAGQLSVSLLGEKPCTSNVDPQNQDLCADYLPQHCTGNFYYSTYENQQGLYELEIVNLCGMMGSVVLQCQGTCAGVVQCSPQIFQTVIQGGVVNAPQDSVVISQNSNNTFYGDKITIELQQHHRRCAKCDRLDC